MKSSDILKRRRETSPARPATREAVPLGQRRKPLAAGGSILADGSVGDTGLKDVPEQVEQEGRGSLSSGSSSGDIKAGVDPEAEI